MPDAFGWLAPEPPAKGVAAAPQAHHGHRPRRSASHLAIRILREPPCLPLSLSPCLLPRAAAHEIGSTYTPAARCTTSAVDPPSARRALPNRAAPTKCRTTMSAT